MNAMEKKHRDLLVGKEERKMRNEIHWMLYGVELECEKKEKRYLMFSPSCCYKYYEPFYMKYHHSHLC